MYSPPPSTRHGIVHVDEPSAAERMGQGNRDGALGGRQWIQRRRKNDRRAVGIGGAELGLRPVPTGWFDDVGFAVRSLHEGRSPRCARPARPLMPATSLANGCVDWSQVVA